MSVLISVFNVWPEFMWSERNMEITNYVTVADVVFFQEREKVEGN